MSDYVLDTSAVFAFIEDEDGADTIHSLIMKALEGTDILLISSVTIIEIFYISCQEQGGGVAEARLELLNKLPLSFIPLGTDAKLTKLVGGIKAHNRMSFADCCIAGLAMSKNATLVHKDPEFDQLSDEILQLPLPYKKKSRQQDSQIE